jgi:hypothetical protein
MLTAQAASAALALALATRTAEVVIVRGTEAARGLALAT